MQATQFTQTLMKAAARTGRAQSVAKTLLRIIESPGTTVDPSMALELTCAKAELAKLLGAQPVKESA